MTNEQIIEGNKALAEFIGLKVEYIEETDEYAIQGKPLSCYNYHMDWNFLMPVCKKLDRLYETVDFIEDIEYERFCDKMDDAVTLYDIKPVFKVTVEFVEWVKFQAEAYQNLKNQASP